MKTDQDSSNEIRYIKNQIKTIDRLEMDLKKMATLKANQNTLEKL